MESVRVKFVDGTLEDNLSRRAKIEIEECRRYELVENLREGIGDAGPEGRVDVEKGERSTCADASSIA